jgi:3-oxoacyl-[acyl-carrier-protein] synthase I
MDLCVNGVGMATSLGLDAVTSCAAFRAGVQRPTRARSLFAIVVSDAPPPEAIPIAVHAVPVVASGFFGYARRLQIASAALADLIRHPTWQDNPRTGFILLVGNQGYRRAFVQAQRKNLEDGDESAAQELAAYESFVNFLDRRLTTELLAAIMRRVPIQTSGAARVTLSGTATGLGAALDQARTWFRAGVCDRCILGEVDSLADTLNVEALDGLGLLKTPDRPAALSPGEAATFVVVAPLGRGARSGDTQAVIGTHCSGKGAAHPRIIEDDKSQETFRDIASTMVATIPPKESVMLVANLNGDPHRSATFSQILHQSSDQRLRDPAYWLPAIGFGDMGAACGLASIALLTRGWQRNYAPSRNALVCLQDDWGGRMVMGVRSH